MVFRGVLNRPVMFRTALRRYRPVVVRTVSSGPICGVADLWCAFIPDRCSGLLFGAVVPDRCPGPLLGTAPLHSVAFHSASLLFFVELWQADAVETSGASFLMP